MSTFTNFNGPNEFGPNMQALRGRDGKDGRDGLDGTRIVPLYFASHFYTSDEIISLVQIGEHMLIAADGIGLPGFPQQSVLEGNGGPKIGDLFVRTATGIERRGNIASRPGTQIYTTETPPVSQMFAVNSLSQLIGYNPDDPPRVGALIIVNSNNLVIGWGTATYPPPDPDTGVIGDPVIGPGTVAKIGDILTITAIDIDGTHFYVSSQPIMNIQGPPGQMGPGVSHITASVDSVTSTPPNTPPVVSILQTSAQSPNVRFQFSFPQPEKGETGDTGAPGADGLNGAIQEVLYEENAIAPWLADATKYGYALYVGESQTVNTTPVVKTGDVMQKNASNNTFTIIGSLLGPKGNTVIGPQGEKGAPDLFVSTLDELLTYKNNLSAEDLWHKVILYTGPTDTSNSTARGDLFQINSASPYLSWLGNIAGPVGDTGPAGAAIEVNGTYPTSADLLADANAIRQSGSAYIVEDTGHLWVWSAASNTFIDTGNTIQSDVPGPMGPQGYAGPQGPQGVAGVPQFMYFDDASMLAWASNAVNQGTYALFGGTSSDNGYVLGGVYHTPGDGTTSLVTNLRGPVGAVGPEGMQGVEGPRGPAGESFVGISSQADYDKFIDGTSYLANTVAVVVVNLTITLPDSTTVEYLPGDILRITTPVSGTEFDIEKIGSIAGPAGPVGEPGVNGTNGNPQYVYNNSTDLINWSQQSSNVGSTALYLGTAFSYSASFGNVIKGDVIQAQGPDSANPGSFLIYRIGNLTGPAGANATERPASKTVTRIIGINGKHNTSECDYLVSDYPTTSSATDLGAMINNIVQQSFNTFPSGVNLTIYIREGIYGCITPITLYPRNSAGSANGEFSINLIGAGKHRTILFPRTTANGWVASATDFITINKFVNSTMNLQSVHIRDMSLLGSWESSSIIHVIRCSTAVSAGNIEISNCIIRNNIAAANVGSSSSNPSDNFGLLLIQPPSSDFTLKAVGSQSGSVINSAIVYIHHCDIIVGNLGIVTVSGYNVLIHAICVRGLLGGGPIYDTLGNGAIPAVHVTDNRFLALVAGNSWGNLHFAFINANISSLLFANNMISLGYNSSSPPTVSNGSNAVYQYTALFSLSNITDIYTSSVFANNVVTFIGASQPSASTSYITPRMALCKRLDTFTNWQSSTPSTTAINNIQPNTNSNILVYGTYFVPSTVLVPASADVTDASDITNEG